MKGPIPQTDFSETPDGFELPEGNWRRGAQLFKKHCLYCHSIRPDGKCRTRATITGPTLWMIWNRTAGMTTTGCFGDRFGHTLDECGFVWTDQNLMKYMKNPRAMVKGHTNMNFFGIPDFQSRVDICHFLHTLEPDHPNGQEILQQVASDKKGLQWMVPIPGPLSFFNAAIRAATGGEGLQQPQGESAPASA
uniref:Cytochrome c domain-containing protein n=1 Tax=Chromera velia CCMP2878 TaxID=1169474 RepID=A0A0G4GY71_9ALVE|mmetsp:Transcript_35277/g.69613  ORF Transcript_35277/g.69613 Transcript_35277/m.69613 type:complete len:192 (-) Transcript_35277:158-733(-)|eukprot:Cvel_23859.t1-p1 / transcript=Cvel_23859.t1 / gene=Cvel_23859 / organism=Chromera_velia_CCMP2878 / gene_product=Cytochrome c type-1, putative / transcript_product=Cytochrome c type-1, putative / location=Cvel_scaffold2510:20419-23453(-) / protein_length=191 / sequence_SO=supercontig / SO=protein_coding / is_pseudo=false